MSQRLIRFYSDSGRYISAEMVLTYERQGLEIKSWIESGNYLLYGSRRIDDVGSIFSIYEEENNE